MTAQERKDFRRVQESRETWKQRAVRRGEDRRRFRERRNEVDRSRQGWRERALAAEHRVEQLEVANHQLTSALTQGPFNPRREVRYPGNQAGTHQKKGTENFA